MVGLHGLSPSVALRVSTCFALAAALIAAANAQEPRYQVDPGIADSETRPNANPPTDTGNQGPGRYDEPPPPPFDFWQPTWMPCQSLRTNRSLVLGHLYWGADILGWASKGVHVPALVTSSSLSNANPGVIGSGDTVIRYGDEIQHDAMRTGGRLTIGWWFDTNQTSGIEWHYFEVEDPRRFIVSVTDNSSVLARPFFNATTGMNDALVIADGSATGSIDIRNIAQLTSTGIDYRRLIWSSEFARVDAVAGYRHTRLYDRIRIEDDSTDSGVHTVHVDQFRTVNQFDGADLGFRGWWSNNGKIAVTSVSKIALGATNNDVIIGGFTATRPPNPADTMHQGLLAQPSNSGNHTRQQFGTVTELGLGLQWQPICNWKFNLGYTWFYWSQVARAASQIDTTVDPSGNGTRPAFRMHTTSYWADGINGGFLLQF